MGFADTMRIWSNINCGLASAVNYGEQRHAGAPVGVAGFNFMQNMVNGIARNQVAYQMQSWGNPIGNNINMMAGYGNPVSNAFGTYALMGACTPWMFFNSTPFLCSPMMGMGGYGFGMMPFGSSVDISFRSSHCHHGRMGYWC